MAVNPDSSEMLLHPPHPLVFCPQSPQDCPQVLPSRLAPMPTGSSQSIPVLLANAAFQVGGGRGPFRVGSVLWARHPHLSSFL